MLFLKINLVHLKQTHPKIWNSCNKLVMHLLTLAVWYQVNDENYLKRSSESVKWVTNLILMVGILMHEIVHFLKMQGALIVTFNITHYVTLWPPYGSQQCFSWSSYPTFLE